MKGAHFVVRLGKVRGQGRYIDPYGGSCASQHFARVFFSQQEADACARTINEHGMHSWARTLRGRDAAQSFAALFEDELPPARVVRLVKRRKRRRRGS